jgi:signal transduction histidine kinase
VTRNRTHLAGAVLALGLTAGAGAATTVALLGGAWRPAAAPVVLLTAVLVSVGLAMLVRGGTARPPAAQPLTGLALSTAEQLSAPLHTITGFTELLLDEAPGLDEESRGFLHRIDAAARRMQGTVDELLAYATAGDALRPEPVEASLLALDVAAAHLPGPSIEIGDLPAVSGDAVLLRRVLDQLVGNAVRFAPAGTPARIAVGAREVGGGWWRIEVADRGIGVPADQRTAIFAPFHRAPAATGYPGAGLGLAVCARIVERHGGAMGVDANPGGGSVFWFTVAGAQLVADQLALSAREPATWPPWAG